MYPSTFGIDQTRDGDQCTHFESDSPYDFPNPDGVFSKGSLKFIYANGTVSQPLVRAQLVKQSPRPTALTPEALVSNSRLSSKDPTRLTEGRLPWTLRTLSRPHYQVYPQGTGSAKFVNAWAPSHPATSWAPFETATAGGSAGSRRS
jgi:hypothetical protein